MRFILLEAHRRGLRFGEVPRAALDGRPRAPACMRDALAPYAARARAHPRPAPPRAAAARAQRIPARPRPHHPFHAPSGGSNTRRRSSSITKAISSARGSRTASKSRRSRARSRAACGLDEDLTEAIALAHDLGHTPFGHAGQDALNACMKPYGGFEHNLQSLRVVDLLEQRYAAFDGLNLTFETREGHPQALLVAQRARSSATSASASSGRQRPSLEAQIANLADEIAYNNHDVDDGLRSGLIDHRAALRGRDLRAPHEGGAEGASPARRAAPHPRNRAPHDRHPGDRPDRHERAQHPRAAPAIDRRGARARRRSSASARAIREEQLELKRFLHENLYRHYRVVAHEQQGAAHRERPFRGASSRTPRLLPPEFQDRARRGQAPRDRRLRRRHDRPLRHPRAPAAVRDRRDLAPHALGAAEHVPAGALPFEVGKRSHSRQSQAQPVDAMLISR